MKDTHKDRHKYNYEENVVVKKCRRKRDRARDRSSSQSRHQIKSRSRDRSRSRSQSSNSSRDGRKNSKRRRDHHSYKKEDDYKRHYTKERRDDASDAQRKHKRKEENYYESAPRSKWENDENDSKNKESMKWGKEEHKQEKKPMENKAKPDFGLSGKLAAEVNTYKGVVIKYSQPPEARKPKRRWRLYPFKGDETLPVLHIHRQSAYLIGRDRVVADIPIDHPSCSKQHAVLQYRLVPYTKENGRKSCRIRPYIIDLESANGTYVNNNKIEPKKFVELLEKDVIKFAYSSREYVVMHDEITKYDAEDDNVAFPEEEEASAK